MNEPLARRERKKERTRQSLLDVAIRLIAERGVYATRVEDITEHTDLGKGAFYNYFDSKDQLIAALVSRGIELLDGSYLAPRRLAGTRAERVAAVIAAHEAFFDDHPVYLVLFHQARGLAKLGGPERTVLSSVFVDYLRRIGLAIVTPEERGALGDTDLGDITALILGAISGYRSFVHAAGRERHPALVAEVLTAGLQHALADRLARRST